MNACVRLLTLLALVASVTAFTAQDGEKIGQEMMADWAYGFPINDMSHMHKYFADTMSWEWSGGVKGAGPKEDMFKTLEGSWQALVSKFIPSNIFIVTDTVSKTVAVSHEIALNIDMRKGEPCWFQGKNVFTFTLDSDNKVTHWEGLWDAGDAAMNACVQKAMGKNEL